MAVTTGQTAVGMQGRDPGHVCVAVATRAARCQATAAGVIDDAGAKQLTRVAVRCLNVDLL